MDREYVAYETRDVPAFAEPGGSGGRIATALHALRRAFQRLFRLQGGD